MFEDESSCGGHLGLSRSSQSIEDRFADGSFETGNLLANGGLREAQSIGRAAERPLLGNGAQGGEVSDLNVLQGHIHKRSRW